MSPGSSTESYPAFARIGLRENPDRDSNPGHLVSRPATLTNKSPALCRREFQERFPGVDPPERTTVHKIVNKFKTTGSVLDKKRRRRRHVLTEEKLDDIGAQLEQSPQKSLTQLAQQAGVSRTSAHNATKLLKCHPYKVTEVHSLEAGDLHRRINFCNWFLQSVNDGSLNPQLVMFSDEAWFHLHRQVITQNTRYWSVDNLRLLHESPLALHDSKVGVWCAINAKRIIGPIFFHETLNADRYQALILDQFFPQLTEEERRYGVFQQDRTTAHTSSSSLRAITDIFEGRVISEGLWPARSPDLTPCDFYLWSSLKDRVYRSNPRTLDELKNNIQREIVKISDAELQHVNQNVIRRYNTCLAANGKHFHHRL
ncbi:hypothetical protein ANN_15647 [Periplaneta americana]|uniref:DUF4817 domain-containing protein n=1 Tax=Periplaneta americana TaxID=6978 RepID=A0ABQ8SHC5_PERAM|nr:hypothetical protein ANN_15647 [Periplaneta americana]